MLIALQEAGVNMLQKLINKIYETGEIPTEFLNFFFVAIPKNTIHLGMWKS